MEPKSNSMILSKRFNATPTLLLLAIVIVASGCFAPEPEFRFNEAYLRKKESEGADLGEQRELVKENVKSVLVGLYGTPNEPHVPAIEGIADVLDLEKLKIAAGKTQSIEDGRKVGLYREHCAHCHGITGDGRGPTSEFLNPYPRDYRRGIFKFKSTVGLTPPTNDDLHRLLIEGIPGTAMPSFRLLKGYELAALVEYVRYLAIRGETERALIDYALDLDEGAKGIWIVGSAGAQAAKEEVEVMVTDVIAPYQVTGENMIAVPEPPENWETPESIARGRELFAGTVANCIKCHGMTALGDAMVTDYDDWTKEFYDVKNPDKFEEIYAHDGAALPPRTIRPRNLRMNVFRGGRRPVDLYWRLSNGIAGTPMPAAPIRSDSDPEDSPNLSTDDVWHIIAYVRNLPFEELSEPMPLPKYQRDRH